MKTEIQNLPQAWKLTPLGKRDSSGKPDPKVPYFSDWCNADVDREFIQSEKESGKATGYGLVLGKPSGYVVAIDFDGQSAIEMGLEKFGELPNTVTWTSGRTGRYQALFVVPAQYRDRVENKKVKTGVNGDDRKAEQIEFRYTGNQSALPPSAHPTTDGYKWINIPIDTPVAELPQRAIDYWLSLLAPKVPTKSKVKTKPESKSHSEAPTILPIPLANCLAKSNRELLRGVTEGGRNHAGATLSRDLIGAANYLDSLGIAYDGDPRSLFDEFCQNCEPPIDDSEANVIWKSAEGDNPEPSCTAEGIDNIIDSWNRKADTDTELSQNLKESLNLKNGKAPNLFGGELGKLLSIAAGNFNIPVEILNFCLLPILGSRIDARTKLMISPGTNFKVPAIRWCGLVGDTGSKKSPVISLLTDPLSRQQIELYDDYKQKKIDYDTKFTKWKNEKPADIGKQPEAPVPMLDLYFSNFTIEALVDSIQYHPNAGSMVMLDELAQFYKSLDMYRGGKGSDRQQWLTIWNGSGLKNNRKASGTVVLPQTSIGILGGIQPETITNMVSGDDSQFDGLWNRFSFVGLPQFKTSAFTETPADLGTELDRVYRALSQHSHQIHCLSIESKPLWEAWHDEIEDKVLSDSTELVKGTYSKFHGIAGRNALILHRTLAAIKGTEPEQLISTGVMELAIAWTKWELSQTLLQYQLLGLTNDPELSRILKFIDKFTGKGWVKPVDVRSWWSVKPKPAFDELKKFMAKVVSLGYAIDNDEPTESSKYQIKILEKSSQSSHSYPETPAETDVQERLSVVTDSKNGIAQTCVGKGLNVVTTNGQESSHNPEPTANGHQGDLLLESVTIGSHSINPLPTNGSRDVVTTLTTFSNKNIFKIGDRAKLGDEIFIIDRIEKDFIGGQAIDGSYIGGHTDSVQSVSVDESPVTPPKNETIDRVPVGNGMVEIVRQGQSETTIDDEEVEYEC